jgi:hypothetical protein
MVKALKFFLPFAFAAAAGWLACNKADDLLSAEEAVDQALFAAQERGGLGSYGCYELVFPVTIQLPNGTTAEVNSYEEIARLLRAFFETNGRPKRGMRHVFSFVFPIAVVGQDGQVITVENEEQMRRLRAQCAGTFDRHGPNGHGRYGVACWPALKFSIPLPLSFPMEPTLRPKTAARSTNSFGRGGKTTPLLQSIRPLAFPS